RTIEQAAQHMQVDDDEEHRRAGGVHVADQPAPRYFAHDVFDRLECQLGIGLVVHDQENAGDDLDDQYQHCQGPEEIPEIEILGCVIFRHVLFEHGGKRKTLVYPPQEYFRLDGIFASHDTDLYSIYAYNVYISTVVFV